MFWDNKLLEHKDADLIGGEIIKIDCTKRRVHNRQRDNFSQKVNWKKFGLHWGEIAGIFRHGVNLGNKLISKEKIELEIVEGMKMGYNISDLTRSSRFSKRSEV